MLDQAVGALIEDLEHRGMLNDMSVVVLGRVRPDPQDQRQRRPRPLAAGLVRLLAGGTMRNGQVIGATNRLGEYPISRPVHFQEVFATLYKSLGLEPDQTTLPDLRGRPQYLVDSAVYRPMPELV